MIFQNVARKFALVSALLVAAPMASFAQFAIVISVHTAPPPLVVYAQPPLPEEGYLWTPGYWAYSDDAGYYWVPGVWVQPPSVGVLWTPAWWGFEGGAYGFHAGYWGPHIGYYGGINYGFGYGGIGFGGGRWDGGHFAYNSVVNNFGGVHVTNVYENRTVINNTTIINNHASFNGPGGYTARPRTEELQYAHEQHIQPTQAQQQHFHTAAATPAQRFSANAGHPTVTAARSPEAFHEQAARLPATPANRGAEPAGNRGAAQTNRDGFGNNAPRPAGQNAAQNGAQAARQPAARPEARPSAQPAVRQAQPESRPQPQARPQARPEPQPAPRPEPQARPETRPAARPQTQPAPRPQAQPRPAPEPRAQAARPEAQRPAPRPEPKAEPRAEKRK